MMRRVLAALSAIAVGAAVAEPSPAAEDEALLAAAGRGLFRRTWVPAPSSTRAADGLGPLFNARSCATCHAGGGGASLRPEPDGGIQIGGAVVRLAGPKGEAHPWYGRQLQTGAVQGLMPEARVSLRVPAAVAAEAMPVLAVELLGPQLEPGYRAAVRVAPSLEGRARLEEIAESAIFAGADANANRADGVRGRVRAVALPDGSTRAGRFGYKAGEPHLAGQIAAALAFDMGLSSPLQPLPYGDCTAEQKSCRARPNGEGAEMDGREVSGEMLATMASYLRGLAPALNEPAPPPPVFGEIGCAACHVPEMRKQDGGHVSVYSDVLLHDMGADLDDGVAEPGVASHEWRTAPLAGLKPAGRSRRYLHDGRAADIAAAVRWHGGEAAASRDAFDRLAPELRAELIRFLERL